MAVEKPDSQLGFLFTQVAFLKQRIINSALKEQDITYIQFIILAAVLELGDDENIVTQQTVSMERLLDKAMVSNVVKTLVDKKLMKRDAHPTDKRAFALSLTDEGVAKALEGKKIAKHIDDVFFKRVNRKDLTGIMIDLLKNNQINE